MNIATAKVNIAINTASLLFDITWFSEVCCVLNFTMQTVFCVWLSIRRASAGSQACVAFLGVLEAYFYLSLERLLEINLN